MAPATRRIRPIIRLLRKHYPEARTALEFGDPLQILVATILAAQCTDERVNRITPGLFRKYPTAEAFAGELAKIRDEAAALDFAIQRELDSIHYYREMRELLPAGQRTAIEQIITEEKGHFVRLSEMKKMRGC